MVKDLGLADEQYERWKKQNDKMWDRMIWWTYNGWWVSLIMKAVIFGVGVAVGAWLL